MAYFFYTKLVECETYENFKEVLSFGSSVCTSDFYCDNYYPTDNYSNTFKGYNFKESYYPEVIDYYFLYEIIPANLKCFLDPEFNVKTKTVTFFENLDKRNKGVRSNPTKMGKFFRKIAPYFNDKQIEFLVNYVVDYFAESVYEHRVAKGNEITEIYLSEAESGRDVGNYSCINASCMRHDDWRIHPTKVYATESWELHYLTNEDGDIAARVLICREDDVYSYIYASCERAGDVLREKLEELGFTDCDKVSRAFDGAKLLKIEGNGGLVAPYIDHHCEVKDCGDHLEITHSYPDYSFSSTSGCVKITHICEECDCECHEEDMIAVGDYLYCQNCVYYCDHFDEYFVGESFEVFYSTYSSYNVCEDALSDMGAIYNEETGEWQTAEWYAECTEEDEEETEDEIEPKKEIAPGVKCIVVGGYETFHWFPIGTVVEVFEGSKESNWQCKDKSGLSQYIEAKDLVVVE